MKQWRVTFTDGNQRMFAATSAKDVLDYLEYEVKTQRECNAFYRAHGTPQMCVIDTSYVNPEDVVSIVEVKEEDK